MGVGADAPHRRRGRAPRRPTSTASRHDAERRRHVGAPSSHVDRWATRSPRDPTSLVVHAASSVEPSSAGRRALERRALERRPSSVEPSSAGPPGVERRRPSSSSEAPLFRYVSRPFRRKRRKHLENKAFLRFRRPAAPCIRPHGSRPGRCPRDEPDCQPRGFENFFRIENPYKTRQKRIFEVLEKKKISPPDLQRSKAVPQCFHLTASAAGSTLKPKGPRR